MYVLVSFLPFFFPLSRFPPHTLHLPRDSDLYTKCFPNSRSGIEGDLITGRTFFGL